MSDLHRADLDLETDRLTISLLTLLLKLKQLEDERLDALEDDKKD
jgi:hypothetical protein